MTVVPAPHQEFESSIEMPGRIRRGTVRYDVHVQFLSTEHCIDYLLK